ncbi:MAG: ABC transporter permease/substrate-binding protein [Peptococcaceae bacterium]|nr:ABC transporter permease/substrate-binding protein [Peptococcaceae bacterium]
MDAFLQTLIERHAELGNLFVEHMEMTSLAVLASLLVGVPIGILITKNKKAASIIIGIANLMQSIPSIGLLAFLVPFVGIGQKPAIIMVVTYALLPIIKNTFTGITSIDPRLLEAANGIGLSKSQQLLKIQLPQALPFIMAGIRISAVTAVGTVTIAAFAGAGGLGWMINLGLNANDANLVLLGAIPACLLALVVDFVLGKVEKALTPEGLKPAEQIVYLPRKKRLFRSGIALALCAVILIVPAGASVAQSLAKNDDKLVIGAENFTEALIFGYLYSDLIQAKTDIPVEEKFNLNGTMIANAALDSGDIDMYTDYTGVIAPNVLKLPMNTDPDAVYKDVKKGMKDEYDAVVSEPLGSSNTYVFAVPKSVSEKYGLTKLSQLVEQAPNLRLGCTTAFTEREDLLPKFESELGAHFKEVTGLEGNIRYQALKSGDVDVTDAYETDGLLIKEGLIPLEDDLQFFPPYQAINIYRSDVIERYPELEDVLSLLDGALTTEEVAQMNYKVDIDGQTPQQVAHDFLEEKGLI